MRVGFGYDSHRLVRGRKLILGGVEVPHHEGLFGHSDADVLIHAICDAILGAIAEGDIGMHFPDTDPAYAGIYSMNLLHRVGDLAEEKGFCIHNVDSTVILEKPKLAGYISEMIANIAHVLDISPDRVNVKAKTNEGMGLTGRNEGAVAFAVVSVVKKSRV
jgi:2-C-methyl-D-erythritol 2,4-cyclodiphosphate synthase